MWLLFASASALCFGVRGISYQWVSRKPLDRNLLLFGVYLCGTLVAAGASALFHQSWTRGALLGLLMGMFSFTSNAAMYKGFAVGKASLVAIFTALPPVVVTIAAFALWRETFHPAQAVAFALIVGGVVLIRFGGLHTVRDLRGIVWAVIALFGFGFTDVSTKAATKLGGETFPTLATMYAVGALLFLISWWLTGAWLGKSSIPAAAAQSAGEGSSESSLTEVSPSSTPGLAEVRLTSEPGMAKAGLTSEPGMAERNPIRTKGLEETAEDRAATPSLIAPAGPTRHAAKVSLRTVGLGMAIGTTNITGMILILSAFRLGITGLVSAVVAMNVVLILLYARLVLKEAFSSKEWSGMALAISGIVILKLLG